MPSSPPVPRKTSLSAAELQIARRLLLLRKERRLSRADLAYWARVDEGAIQRAEMGRAPLQYEVARRILVYLDVNPYWFATGTGPYGPTIRVPAAYDIGALANASFLAVFEEFLQPSLARQFGRSHPQAAFKGEDGNDEVAEALDRVMAFKVLSGLLGEGLASLDRAQITEFREVVRSCMQSYMDKQPAKGWEFRLRGKADLASVSKEMEEWRRAFGIDSRSGLTSESDSGVVSTAMSKSISTWPELREKLARITAKRGFKAKLARLFQLTPQAVSEWMLCKSSPSADLAIRLLRWVSDGGSLEQKSAASAATPSAPKTQSKEPTREGKPKHRRR